MSLAPGVWDCERLDRASSREILRRYAEGHSKHRLAKEDDYISTPKASGYRSHHLMMRFNGTGDRDAFTR